MLKTNSKKAKENLFKCMIENVSGWDSDPKTAQEAAYILASDYINANRNAYTNKIYLEGCSCYQDHFEKWARGLTNNIFDMIFYHGEAKKLLKEILEETDEEAARFTEDQAASKICALLWIHGGVSDCFYKLYKGF